MAMVVLATLAIGAGALAAHARSGIALQRHRQAALGLAQARLEEVRAAPFSAVRPATASAAAHFVSRPAGAWVVSERDPGEILQAGGRAFPIVTRVQWADADGGAESQDALAVTVIVRVRPQAGDEVVLGTWRAPGGYPP